MKKATPAGKGRKLKAPSTKQPLGYGKEKAPSTPSLGYTGVKPGASKVKGNTASRPKFNAAAFERAKAKHFNLPQPGSKPKLDLKFPEKAKGKKQTEARAEDYGQK